jgi:hypothetical protein
MDGEKVLNLSNRVCGSCCWFKNEGVDGFGICKKPETPANCVFGCAHVCRRRAYVSLYDKERYMLDLQQHADYVNGKEGIEDIDPKRLQKAVKFVIDYMKTL